jgi:hypothetical protein
MGRLHMPFAHACAVCCINRWPCCVPWSACSMPLAANCVGKSEAPAIPPSNPCAPCPRLGSVSPHPPQPPAPSPVPQLGHAEPMPSRPPPIPNPWPAEPQPPLSQCELDETTGAKLSHPPPLHPPVSAYRFGLPQVGSTLGEPQAGSDMSCGEPHVGASGRDEQVI